MEQLIEAIEKLENSDRVKVILPSGIYLEGKKKKVMRDVRQFKKDLKIIKIEKSFVPLPYRLSLCKEVIIYVNYNKEVLCEE